MPASKFQTRAAALLILLVFAGGCVVGDHLTTYTLNADGSADMVIFGSNLRSTEKGSKAADELAEYKAHFDDRSEDELARIRDSGGTIVDASWIRRQVPFSNLVHAHFPDPAAVEKFLTIKNDDGSHALKTTFRSDGTRRSFTFQIVLPPGEASPTTPGDVVRQWRQSMANGLSDIRVALAKGTITTARGFTIADDMQSALFDSNSLAQIIQTGGKGELYLEWDVSP
jgi:hypothetical protein